MFNDVMGMRMKKNYETIPKIKLYRRIPVAIRIDGKSFHTYTKGFNKPFDDDLIRAMQNTMYRLCNAIQGCVFGYTQSDEITLILIDYNDLNTEAYFDYEVQKLCSVISSMATAYFNDEMQTFSSYLAMFDCRCFNIPKEEVANLIYWRQCDATRNSIQMVGQSQFSQKELQGKSCNDIQNMLLIEKNINWNDYPVVKKRGTACKKINGCFVIDYNMPIIKQEDRKYVNETILYEE